MRRFWRAALWSGCLLLASQAVAQVHGIPASVTSHRPGDTFLTPRGIPASVTSLGPRGFSQRDQFIPVGPLRRNRLGRPVATTPIPLFFGTPYYPIVYLPVVEEGTVQRVVEPSTRVGEPQRIIVEIRDTRPLPESHAAKEAVAELKPTPRVEEPEAERTATIFIFQDGSRQELKDFAITDTELIDLSQGLIRRTPLASLDRLATLKANAAKGIEVRFPAASSD